MLALGFLDPVSGLREEGCSGSLNGWVFVVLGRSPVSHESGLTGLPYAFQFPGTLRSRQACDRPLILGSKPGALTLYYPHELPRDLIKMQSLDPQVVVGA